MRFLHLTGGVEIEQRSNMMIALTVTNGIEIEWDGEMRLYVKVRTIPTYFRAFLKIITLVPFLVL